ncbi:hypothetical protein [Aeromonas veronii]
MTPSEGRLKIKLRLLVGTKNGATMLVAPFLLLVRFGLILSSGSAVN